MSANPDFEMFGVVDLPHENAINIDEATDMIFAQRDWPLLGGPSGLGWSYFSTAGRCAQLFKRSYDVPLELATRKTNATPLQVGALFHTLEALFYGAGLGNAYALADATGRGRCGGLVSEEMKLPGRRKRFTVPPTAADDFLVALRAMCADDQARSPDANIVEEAERLFDRHTNWWGDREDVTPLGVEVFAAHPIGYTCRYDMIARVGNNDPLLPPGIVVFEKKSAKWIDEKYIDGWSLDGEVLGQIMCWKVSGMEELFGPLSALVVDVVSKGKTPDCRRIVLPPTLPAVKQHERWIRWQQAEVNQWRASRTYPQKFGNCRGQYGLCDEFQNCVLGLTE